MHIEKEHETDIESEEHEPLLSLAIPKKFIVLGSLVILGILLFTVFTRPSGFVKMESGPAQVINIDGLALEGTYLFTTVKVEDVNSIEFLRAKITGDKNLIDSTTSTSSSSTWVSSVERMEGAKRDSAQAAANFLNPSWSISAAGAKIISILPGSPAEGELNLGDVIIGLNGQDVSEAPTFTSLLEEIPANGEASILIDRKGKQLTEMLNLTGNSLGVEVMTQSPSDLRFDISTENVGGASAGLMFTLAGVDALTDGDLAGGRVIAGTGTIQTDGSVGAVGGSPFKAQGAAQAGAEIFFVPQADYPELKDLKFEGMEIVPVNSLEDAMTFLCSGLNTSKACLKL